MRGVSCLFVASVTLLAAGCAPSSPPPDSTTYRDDRGRYRCTLHEARLKAGWADVEYGLLRITMPENDHRMLTFPNAKTWVAGGCSYDESHLSDRVWYCPRCRKAEGAWVEQQQALRPDHDGDNAPAPATAPAKRGVDDPAELARETLATTDYDAIKTGMHVALIRLGKLDPGHPQAGPGLDAIVGLARKLEAGWPGFKGPIIALRRGGGVVRATQHDLLEWQYVQFALLHIRWTDPALFERAWLALEPRTRGGDLHGRWLFASTVGFLGRDQLTQIDGSRPATSGRDAAGREWVQTYGWTHRGVPARHLRVTDGRRSGELITCLWDEGQYPAETIIAARVEFDEHWLWPWE